jgi:protein with PEP-CTERM/exosortase system signal
MKIIRKFALCALLAVALACNANAKEEGKQQKTEKVKPIDALPDGKKDKRTYSVPDAGSTAALLGVSVALVALARRKIARVE